MIRRPPRSTRTDTRFPDTRSSDLRGGESRREQGKWLVRYRMTGRDIEAQGLASRPSRNENDPVRTARKRIGERLAHCTIYEARPAAERQAPDGDLAVEAIRDFCEAQPPRENGLPCSRGQRRCAERGR